MLAWATLCLHPWDFRRVAVQSIANKLYGHIRISASIDEIFVLSVMGQGTNSWAVGMSEAVECEVRTTKNLKRGLYQIRETF
ncbi:hypothetical protein BKM16_02275 [Pseudomonas amygdali pv. morsprunorum]|nr:hypothetical protein AL054_17740 [Pseudomonas amygdali pv. morsprunorum]KWS77228.1 hypothetical protein AL052_03070 [Pseudomonas amygdali pv. eriobotryae]PHX25969.1 hypothetical protein AO282_17660 [Pseudomonas amygdali pv. morsprunorum]POC92125.1 hypothetical protein BKM08_02130 [Pseudomonas amygdali pv. morsprunorum]POD47993.1 hypothetical protein BKM16_02275 [Pseudomonas amygdali pv. morsprunorum]